MGAGGVGPALRRGRDDSAVAGGRMVGARGRPGDRVNRGRLGPKDLFGWHANHAPDRLTTPLIRGDGHLVARDRDTAMARIVARAEELPGEDGPGALVLYTSGQLSGGVLHPRDRGPRRDRHQHRRHLLGPSRRV